MNSHARIRSKMGVSITPAINLENFDIDIISLSLTATILE